MRYSFRLFYFLCICLFSKFRLNAQVIPPGTTHIEKIIAASFKDDGDTMMSSTSYTYYDSAWKVLTNSNTLSAALKPGSHQATVIDTPVKKVTADIKPNGDTLDFIVYLFDSAGNRIDYFQIRKGDTLNNQKRTYDLNHNNTELYNYENHKYYLYMKFEYDTLNNETATTTFDTLGKIVEAYKYERNYKKGITKTYRSYKGSEFKLRYSTQKKGNTIRTDYYVNSNGINYGIMMLHPQGGHSITENDENGNLIKMEVFNKKGTLVTYVYITYTDYP